MAIVVSRMEAHLPGAEAAAPTLRSRALTAMLHVAAWQGFLHFGISRFKCRLPCWRSFEVWTAAFGSVQSVLLATSDTKKQISRDNDVAMHRGGSRRENSSTKLGEEGNSVISALFRRYLWITGHERYTGHKDSYIAVDIS